MVPTLNLVVLRSANIDQAMAFYSKLGLNFIKHRHGTGPEHYSAELVGAVLNCIHRVKIKALRDYPTAVISQPKDSEWGRRAIVADPDGHRIELLEKALARDQ